MHVLETEQIIFLPKPSPTRADVTSFQERKSYSSEWRQRNWGLRVGVE